MNRLEDLLGLSYDKLASSKEFIGTPIPELAKLLEHL